jgi:hypothetical protein
MVGFCQDGVPSKFITGNFLIRHCETVNLIKLAEVRVQWWAFVKMVNLQIS